MMPLTIPTAPVREFKSLTYGQRVYPAAVNAWSSSVRIRQNYTSSFWRGLRADRTVANVTTMGGTIAQQSMWDLDADTDFQTRQPDTRVGTDGAPGVLQNNYTQIHSAGKPSTPTNVTGSAQYARRHTIQNIRSVVGPEGIAIPETGSSYTSPGQYRQFSPNQMFAGQALWQGGAQSGKNPWYNSYADYINEMRLKGQDYSIVPEFRISDHIEAYIKTHKGNFFSR